MRAILQSQVSMIPALKATIAHYGGDAAWPTGAPAARRADAGAAGGARRRARGAGFDMPGIKG